MLTAAAIHCTVALWPAATAGDIGHGLAPDPAEPDLAESGLIESEAAAIAEAIEPRRPS